MSFPNIVYGRYGMEKESSAAKNGNLELGQRMILPDGRIFTYAKADTAAALAVGALCVQKAVSSSGHVVSITGSGAVAGTTIIVTLSATGAVTANQFEDGYIQSYKGGTAGYMYKVKSNNSAAVSSTCTFKVREYDPLKAPIASATTSVYIRENEFKEVLVRATGTASVGIPAGVPANSVPAGYYFWLQRQGPCSVLASETVGLVGEPAVCSSADAGGVTNYTIAADTAAVHAEWAVGRFMIAPAQSTDYAMVYLTLDGGRAR